MPLPKKTDINSASHRGSGNGPAALSTQDAASRTGRELAPRRRPRLGPDVVLALVGWLALIAFTAMTVGQGITGHKVFLGTDLLTQWTPWSAVTDPIDPTNIGVNDTIDSATPTSIFMAENARDGVFAQWDPYHAGGTEAGSLPNSAMLSPLSLPWWILPFSIAPAAVKILEIAAVALGMHLLLRRRWGLPAFTAPLASLIYVSSGFMISWTNWPQTRVAALIPLLFWVTDRLAVERRWMDAIPMGLVVASMLLGGFPAVTVYAIYAAVAYFFVRAIGAGESARHVLMSLVRSGAGVILAVMVSAVQILPFVWFSTHYVDFEARSFNGHLDSSALTTAIVPRMFGNPDAPLSQPNHFIESFSYIGAASLILVVAAILVRPRRTRPAGVTTFFALALVLVGAAVYFGGVAFDLLHLLPAVGSSPVGRMRAILGFFVAILAALGAAAVYEPRGLGAQLRLPASGRPRWVVSGLVSLACATAVLAPVLTVVLTADPPAGAISDAVRNSLLILGLVAVAALVAALPSWRLLRMGVAASTIVLVAMPAISVARTWWPLSDADTFYPRTPAIDQLSDTIGQNRLASVGRAMSPATPSIYGMRSITGHTFSTPQWHEVMAQVAGGFHMTPTFSTIPPDALKDAAASKVLDRFGVTYIVASPNSEIPGQVEANEGATSQLVLSEEGGALDSQVFTGPVRGLQLKVLQQENLPRNPGTLTVRLVDEQGEVLASTTELLKGIGGNENVALVGEDIAPETAWHAELLFESSSARITLAANDDGAAIVSPVRPLDDGLRIVHTGDATLIERDRALDRIRWATGEVAVPDAAERLAMLKDPGTPDDVVVLEHEGDLTGVHGSRPATVTATDVNVNTVNIEIDAVEAGWVIIADPMRDNGWSATLDGQAVELVDAEHAAVAVHVPEAGHHTLELSYSAPHFKAGVALSGASVAGIILVAAWCGIGRMRRRAHASSTSRNESGSGV